MLDAINAFMHNLDREKLARNIVNFDGYSDFDVLLSAMDKARRLRAEIEAERIVTATRQEHRKRVSDMEKTYGPCICNGANECPGCNEQVADELKVEIAAANERF